MPRLLAALSVVSVSCLVGCQSAGVHHVHATPEVSAESMASLASLEGEWEMVQDDGTLGEGSVFAVTAGGSAVREIMFPGNEYEMTNLYHMDGDAIVCTHYCAAGNQPRMVAEGIEQTDTGPSMHFKVDSVSNFAEGQDHYMGWLRLTFVDADTIRQDWVSFDENGNEANTMTFTMKRKS